MKKSLDGKLLLSDPLYKFISVDEETQSFILESAIFEEERSRAKRLHNLGLVRYFFPSASHSKWEHHLGTYHLISESQKFTSFLNSEEFRLLKFLNFFSCFGYTALGYCSAEALLVAAQQKSDLKDELISDYLQPVYKEAKAYADNHSEYKLREMPDDIIKRYRYKALNAWFGAFKLLNIPVKNLPKKLWKKELYAALLSDSSKPKKAYFELAKLEYLQRDLFYTQIVSFNIPIGRAIENHRKHILGDAYNELMESLRAMITREVYTHPQFLALESLAKQAIVDKLISGEMSINDLISKDDQWVEEQIGVRDMVKKVEAGQLILRESTLLDFGHLNKSDKDYTSRNDLGRVLHGSSFPNAEFGYILSPTVEQRSFSNAYNKFRAFDIVLYALNKPKLQDLIQSLGCISELYKTTKLGSVDISHR